MDKHSQFSHVIWINDVRRPIYILLGVCHVFPGAWWIHIVLEEFRMCVWRGWGGCICLCVAMCNLMECSNLFLEEFLNA